MLEVLTGNQITFHPISAANQRLRGEIELKNANNSRFLVYKIKSTDIDAFQADPSKGILNPFETKIIPVLTTRQVDADYARILAQKNKFLIEYVLLNTRPNSIDQAASSLKSSNIQNVKIYINTDSVRGFSSINTNREPSAIGTNKISYHSVAHGRSLPSPPLTSNSLTPMGNQLQILKQQISRLESQRARLKDYDGARKDNKGGIIKYVLLFTLGLIAGNIGSKQLGINKIIYQKLAPPPPTPVIVQKPHQQQGFFSIFNFGSDQPKQVVKQVKVTVQVQQEKPWWNIL